MKKIAFLSALALCLGFTSCDNYEEPNPPAQSNAQDAVLEANGLVFSAGSSVVDEAGNPLVVNLAQLNDEGAAVNIANVDFTSEFPADYTLKLNMEVAKDDSFSKVVTVPAEVVDGVVTVSPDALQGAYVSVCGKNPAEGQVAVRFAAYAVNGDSQARIGNPDFYYGPFTVKVLPFPSDFVIEEAYYLVGTACDWDLSKAIKFSHSDKNVYDDPVFTLAVDIQGSEWWWKIVPASSFDAQSWDGLLGVEENGDESLEGMLVSEDPQAGNITEPNQYLLTINMLDGTYEFSVAIPYLYTPGNSNGWNQTSSQMLFTDDYANYRGFVHLNGGFKFTNAPDWNHTNYGWAADGELSTDPGAGNLDAANDALYWVNVDVPGLTYNITEITSLGIIGDATPKGWDGQTNLTASADFLTWTGDFTLTGGKELKFRANDNWDINLGGDLDDLSVGGPNIKIDADGTYTVTLNLATLPYTATIVKK